MPTERLYLYALTRPDGSRADASTWTYVGATVNPKGRAQKWARTRPGERFKVLMIGAEEYVLEMERKLIRLCLDRGIPIRNQSTHNVPLAKVRAAGRAAGYKTAGKGARRVWELYPERMREVLRENRRKNGSKGIRRAWELHPERMREAGRKGRHVMNHVQHNIVDLECTFCALDQGILNEDDRRRAVKAAWRKHRRSWGLDRPRRRRASIHAGLGAEADRSGRS